MARKTKTANTGKQAKPAKTDKTAKPAVKTQKTSKRAKRDKTKEPKTTDNSDGETLLNGNLENRNTDPLNESTIKHLKAVSSLVIHPLIKLHFNPLFFELANTEYTGIADRFSDRFTCDKCKMQFHEMFPKCRLLPKVKQTMFHRKLTKKTSGLTKYQTKYLKSQKIVNQNVLEVTCGICKHVHKRPLKREETRVQITDKPAEVKKKDKVLDMKKLVVQGISMKKNKPKQKMKLNIKNNNNNSNNKLQVNNAKNNLRAFLTNFKR